MEIWKDIEGYDGKYQVSNLGRIRSINTCIVDKFGKKRLYKGRIRIATLTHNGYYKVELSKNNVTQTRYVHRLVAFAFIENSDPQIKTEVNHINFDKSDNSVTNLEWVSRQENEKHKWENRTFVPSEKLRNQCRLNQLKATEKAKKPILQFTLDGEFIARYSSVREAINITGVKCCGECANGSRKTAGGYLWKYEYK